MFVKKKMYFAIIEMYVFERTYNIFTTALARIYWNNL
jgi:hypothetical protein